MKHIRSFPFESDVKLDNNRIKFELSLDVHGTLDLFSEANLSEFKSLMGCIGDIVLMKNANYEREKIAYKDHYVNEIIKRMRRESKVVDEKPDHMKVDLKQLIERRDALIKRISSQLDYLNDNKHKLDQMEAKRQNYWKTYPGPLVITNDKELIFEGVNEYGNIYFLLQLTTSPQEDQSETGFAWLEFSKQFNEETKRISPNKPGPVRVTSSKPRSDIRILRKSGRESKVMFKFERSYFYSYAYFRLIFYLLHTNSRFKPSKTVKLEKNHIFDLLTESHSIPKSEMLSVQFYQGEGNIYMDRNNTTLEIYGIDEEDFHIQIPYKMLELIKKILPHLTSMKIIYVNKLSPIYLQFEGKIEGILAFNPHTSITKQRHQQLFIKYLCTKLTDQESKIVTEITKLSSIYIPSHDLKRGINWNLTWDEILDEVHRKALNILNAYDKAILKDNQKIMMDYPTNTEIRIDKGKLVEADCDCGVGSINYPCQHQLAIIAKTYLEGWTNE